LGAGGASVTDEEEDNSPPVRLRFSPGFIVFLSAALLAYVVGPWSVLAVVLPLGAFVAITRTPTESIGDALRRFFRSDDLPYEYEAPSQSLAMPKPEAPSTSSQTEPIITGSNVGAMVWNKEADLTGTAPVEPVVVGPATQTTPLSFAEAQAEADQFAKEAESGAHGGMGLGDVKLAVAIGAILGPGQAFFR
jgi:prepilin signal peptidase PulO-like enzyme (type II secretory pathway)